MLRYILAAWCGFWGGVIAAAVLLLVALSLSGCAASQPATAEQAPPTLGTVQHLDSLTLKNWLPSSLAGLPPYLIPAPAGSTPKQRRQWQKAQAQNLARAGVQPSKVKNSSVATAPGATAINRPSAPVATAPHASASDNRKAGQRHGAAATAPHATASTTNRGGLPWWVFLLVAVSGAIGWEVLSARVAPVRQLLKWRVT